jgi:hypothetical protein
MLTSQYSEVRKPNLKSEVSACTSQELIYVGTDILPNVTNLTTIIGCNYPLSTPILVKITSTVNLIAV